MTRRILIDGNGDMVRTALTHDGVLVEIRYEDKTSASISGNIYVGRVMNILPGIGAAFVDVGLEKNVFLPIGENKPTIPSDILESGAERYNKKKLRVGDELVVQVLKEPNGSKGAMVDMQLSFPGRSLVLLPGQNYIGISKKITNREERARLKRIVEDLLPSDHGVIIRTIGENKTEEELCEELNRLVEESADVYGRSKYIKAPALIKKELGPAEKAVRDLFGDEIDEIITNTDNEYALVSRELEAVSAKYKSRVKRYNGGEPLFREYFIEGQIEKALHKRVWLNSGAFIVIEQTEACVVIDVNTGKQACKKDIRAVIAGTNAEAAVEIARQLRLRNLSGMIIVDFIDMSEESDRAMVRATLEAEISKDRIKTVVVGMTELGLMQLTRKKTTKPLSAVLTKECGKCSGTGRIINTDC